MSKDKKKSEQTPIIVSALGRRVQDLRKEKGLTQRELAAQCKVSSGTIGGVELGQKKPGMRVLQAIAAALDVSVDYLINGVGDAFPILPSPSRAHYSALPNINVDTPILGQVSAGDPSMTPPEYWISLREKLGLDPSRHLVITVASEAENSVGFYEGDTVVVDMKAPARSGNWVFGSRGGLPALFRLNGNDGHGDVRVAGVVIYCFRHM